MAIKLKIGLDVISSYKRLAYTPWHALAEFVDNSTQSYFDDQQTLDGVYDSSGTSLTVSISYDRDQSDGFLRVADNAMGMSLEELRNALHVARPPENTDGRSKYGMGLKTAACWIGNEWSVRTKKLGETREHTVTVKVEEIAAGNNELPYKCVDGKDVDLHYTIVEITQHNRKFQGRTLGKIRDFLRSMYREDFRNNILTLEWQGTELVWDDIDDKLLNAQDGKPFKKEFNFEVGDKPVHGWVGILARGSRAEAGLSIIYCGRVIRGWPDSWRPSSLYGQIQGSNDLVNQRLVGEIHLDLFTVSHTKDDILWLGTQEEDVERGLLESCNDYKEMAKEYRKGTEDERGPSDAETETAIDELKRELSSPEMVDLVTLEPIPEESVVVEAVTRITQSVVESRDETVKATVGTLDVKIYVVSDLSPNDPYVTVEATHATEVIIIVNMTHPHFLQLKGSEGVLNYLRHCTYDGIAEWQARSKAGRIDPNTIKLLKDKLLRVPFSISDETIDAS